jgi:hypothetical protein
MRGGFGTIGMQKELMLALDRDGLADIVPTTTDSYTRNEMFELAQKGLEESGARRPLDAERVSDRQLRPPGHACTDRGDRQAGHHAHRHDDAQAHR